MFDMIVAQAIGALGMKPEEMREMAEGVVERIKSIDDRLKNIEARLGIKDEGE